MCRYVAGLEEEGAGGGEEEREPRKRHKEGANTQGLSEGAWG